MTDDENFIVEGIRLAKRIIKGLGELDAEIKKWQSCTEPKIDEYIKEPEMKNVTPPKKAIDVEYHVTEGPHPQRNQKTKKIPPK